MTSDTQFTWSRRTFGAEVAGDMLVWSGEREEYDPLDPEWSPRLLDAVLVLDLDDERAVKRFASEWGPLGTWHAGLEETTRPPRSETGRSGESLDVWRHALSDIQVAGWLYGAIREGDTSKISVYLANMRGERITHRRRRDGKVLWEAADSTLTPIKQRATEGLRADVNKWLGRLTSLELREAPRNQSYLTIVPRTLLGAAWLQLAYDVDRHAEPVRCTYCGKVFFGRSPAKRRGPFAYCTPSHRVLASRKRKRARTLLAGGLTPKEIARQLDLGAAFVRDALKAGDENEKKTRRR